MRILSRYMLRTYLPSFLSALLFFSLIIELADLFVNLARYIQNQTPLTVIAQIQALYLPKCLSYSLPIAVIFSVSFTLGTFYSNNELIAVFSSGVSLLGFIRPLLLFALFISFAGFAFDELVVIQSLKQKTELSKVSLGFMDAQGNSDVVLFDKGTSVVYRVGFFRESDPLLQDILIVVRDENSSVKMILKAASALWDGGKWNFSQVDRYVRDKSDPEGKKITLVQESQYSDPYLNLEPRSFRRLTVNMDELRIDDALQWLGDLQRSGLPYRAAMLDFHERFSFALTPLLVAFLSSSIGSKFKKNILFLSLIISLAIAVFYYVLQMLAGLLSGFNLLNPVLGAWSGFLLFSVVGLFLFRNARS